MKSSGRKRFAIAWLAVAIPFGGVAAFQLYCMLTGLYDPVADDKMPPDNVADHRAWLADVVIVAFVSSLFAGWYLRRKSQKPHG